MVYSLRIPHWIPEQRRVAVLFNDITVRKRAEEELREMNRSLEQRVAERTAEAERRTEELSALAAELARTEHREQRRLAQWLHDDLQQALVAIKMQVALTLASTKKPSLRELLAKASRMIDESIEQSRLLTAELTPPILYECGLAPALGQLSRWMAEKYLLHVTLKTKADVKLENQEAAVIIFSTVRELLFNVVKHAGVSEASVTVSEKNGNLLLSVEDRGAGFDPALVQGAKSGIGLLYVRERLHLIRGELQVRSAPGQGTCITVLAPASRVPPARETAESETESSETTGARVALPLSSSDLRSDSPIRVLLVDDHRMVREGLAGLLETEAGFEVVGQAGDGYEAVEMARKLAPDIVTMDVTMPRMNGIEATRRIKSELPHVRIIGLSMHGEKEQGAAMVAAGAEAYLNKGGASEELLMTILNIARH
jgi:signal transduction histidine kinase